MFTWVDICSTQPLCRGIQSAFRRVTHQRPRRRRRRRVYFGPFRSNPENNGVDQIVTRPSVRVFRRLTAAAAAGGGRFAAEVGRGLAADISRQLLLPRDMQAA